MPDSTPPNSTATSGIFGATIQNFDRWFYEKLKAGSFLTSWDPFFKLYTRLGDWPFTTLLFLSVFLFLPKQQWFVVYLHGIINCLLSFGVYWAIKNTVCRPRPFVKYHKEAGVPPLDEFSFPSGHTMNNLAIGYTLMSYSTWLGAIAVFFPITCGLLRIYYNVHYLTDVLAGILLGFLCSQVGKFLIAWLIL